MTQDAAPPLDNGRYRLVDVLGQGGMASVYRSWDARLQVWRAIKVLDERLADRGSLRTRFDNEARTMARLHHRNIVTVHDVGHDGRRVYLVMELVDGGSLAGWVEKYGPMPPRMAIEVLREVLGALQIAHDNGVVHRDIKPHNILVDRDGTPKVSDFGIARLADTDHSLTRTGAMMGTWTYMAPEQRTSARRVDARADVYAAGATLYALLTGKEPYDLYTTELHEELFAAMPEDLATLIKRATRYKPEDRFASALAMRAALDEVRADHPTMPPGTPPLSAGGTSGVSAPPPAPVDPALAASAAARSDPTLYPGGTWAQGEGAQQVLTSPTALPLSAPQQTMIPSPSEGDGTLSDEMPPIATPLRSVSTSAPGEPARGWAPWVLVLLLTVVVMGLVGVVGGLGVALVSDLGGAPEPEPVPEVAPVPVAVPAPAPAPLTTEPPDPTPEPVVVAPEPVPEPVAEAPRPRPRPAPVVVAPVPAPAPAPEVVVKPRPAVPTGTLGVNSVPYFSELTIDGQARGSTPWTGDIAEGSHAIVLVGSKGGRAELRVDVVAGVKKVMCWDYATGAECQRSP